MWEISHSQVLSSGKFRQSLKSANLCDISHMAGSIDIDAIREVIASEMEKKGFSRRSLALRAGLGQTSIRDVLERTDNPGIGTLTKIAEALDISFEEISGSQAVDLVGEIGAGGLIAYFKDDSERETVPRPPLAPGPMFAFKVEGGSMLPKYEPGDVIYVRRDHDGLLPAYINRYCAVNCADGGTYLKILAPGTAVDRYTLRSLNAPDMENVEVIWAAPVLFVMPRR